MRMSQRLRQRLEATADGLRNAVSKGGHPLWQKLCIIPAHGSATSTTARRLDAAWTQSCTLGLHLPSNCTTAPLFRLRTISQALARCHSVNLCSLRKDNPRLQEEVSQKE